MRETIGTLLAWFVIFIVIAAFGYLFGAFIAADWNFANWVDIGRAAVATCVTAVFAFAVIYRA